ncbi:MAG: amino acid permease [Halieaceae bacterium]|jgi:APA family basic amino acid/polyamine antiporter|nr:amino acid permease [Halieaceae bacterium]
MTRFRPRVAAAIVIANMIGTGVFTSLGFQLVEIQSAPVILALWAVGGIAALCGALSYAELGAALPRSGGEYNFLTEIYHPMAGFISGWVSATVGFAAPTALAAMTFGSYLSAVFPQLSAIWLATGLIVVLALAHSRSHRSSGSTQSLFTVLKILLIIGFAVLALLFNDAAQDTRFAPAPGDGALLLSGAFAVSLIYVNYAYSGWNAATYISGELENPQRWLPRVLVGSTALVGLSYLLLNSVFLAVAPMEAMAGKVEVGFVAARFAFGEAGGTIMGLLLGLLLVSTVSAMVLAGPRVLHRIGEDFTLFRLLGRSNADGIPTTAVLVQAALALAFLWSASFDRILVFSGATMALNTFFTVLGVFILRWRQPSLPRPFRTWLYPLPPLLFLLITGWTLLYVVLQRPVEAMITLLIVGSGAAFYFVSCSLGAHRKPPGAGREAKLDVQP